MNILALGSMGTAIGVSLLTDKGYFENLREIGLQHNQVLMELVRSLTAEASFDAAFLDLIVVTAGPGSFTSLRILMATAKGIAAARSTPLVAVPTFDVIGNYLSFFQHTVVPVLDGKKGRFYSALYRQGKKIRPEADTPGEELIEEIRENSPALIVGEDAPKLFPDGLPREVKVLPFPTLPGPHLIAYGVRLYKKGKASERSVSPLYIRKSDAEQHKNG